MDRFLVYLHQVFFYYDGVWCDLSLNGKVIHIQDPLKSHKENIAVILKMLKKKKVHEHLMFVLDYMRMHER